MYNVTLRQIQVTTVAVEKKKTYYVLSMCVCILALANRQAKYIIPIILSSVACLVINFFMYLINGIIFKENLLNIKCVF